LESSNRSPRLTPPGRVVLSAGKLFRLELQGDLSLPSHAHHCIRALITSQSWTRTLAPSSGPASLPVPPMKISRGWDPLSLLHPKVSQPHFGSRCCHSETQFDLQPYHIGEMFKPQILDIFFWETYKLNPCSLLLSQFAKDWNSSHV